MGERNMAGNRAGVGDQKLDPETFRDFFEKSVNGCSGGFCDCFCPVTGEPVNPITIFLTHLKVPTFWVGLWSNVKATHTPMKDKLLEFLTPDQHKQLVRAEEIYINSKKITSKEKKKMLGISGQSD
jgi:hypothetical protein